MNLFFSLCKQAQPIINFAGGFHASLNNHNNKDKVVVVMGATGTGKSKLSINLATQFSGEIINSDKMQVYKGLDIVTNKVSQNECQGVPHHLLGVIDPDLDYTSSHFRHDALHAMQSIVEQKKLPIIAGGSNSFIESLVNDDPNFKEKYECCFLWVDVSLPVLEQILSKRVDRMVEVGLIDEVRRVFDPRGDYTQGIRRAIGVPEMDRFLRAEEQEVDQDILEDFLKDAINEIKENTRKLANRQVRKIDRLREFCGWKLHRINSTEAFLKHGEVANEAWGRLVVSPSVRIVSEFLSTTKRSRLRRSNNVIRGLVQVDAATH